MARRHQKEGLTWADVVDMDWTRRRQALVANGGKAQRRNTLGASVNYLERAASYRRSYAAEPDSREAHKMNHLRYVRAAGSDRFVWND